MNKDHVNRVNTRTWIKCNADNRSHLFREKFVSVHGGMFVKSGKYWVWDNIGNLNTFVNVPKHEKTIYLITTPDGIQLLVDNLSQFCEEHNLNRSIMYAVVRGDRNHHKNYKIVKLLDN